MKIEVLPVVLIGSPIIIKISELEPKQNFDLLIKRDNKEVFSESFTAYSTQMSVDMSMSLEPYISYPDFNFSPAGAVVAFDPMGVINIQVGEITSDTVVLPGGTSMGNSEYFDYLKNRIPVLLSGYDGTLVHKSKSDLIPIWMIGGEDYKVVTSNATYDLNLSPYVGKIVRVDLNAIEANAPLYSIEKVGKTPFKVGVVPDFPDGRKSIVWYRNSFGVFERITFFGAFDKSETSSDEVENYLRYDTDRCDFVRFTPRKTRLRKWTINTGYLHSEFYNTMIADLLRSEEIYIKLDFDWKIKKCTVETQDLSMFTSDDSTRVRGVDLVFTDIISSKYL